MDVKRFIFALSAVLFSWGFLSFAAETAFDRLPPIDANSFPVIPDVKIPAAGLHQDPPVEGERAYIDAIKPRVRALVVGINKGRQAKLLALEKAGKPVPPRDRWVVRDAHGKANACLRATFRTLAGLAPEYLQGTLKLATRGLPAIIRLSNGMAENDLMPDGHGFALKIMTDLAKGISDDRIFINHRNFFSKDAEYGLFAQASLGGKEGVAKFFSAPSRIAHEGVTAALTAHPIASPLDETYYTMTPYWLGEGADRKLVKYSVRPCAGQDLLGEAKAKYLAIEQKIMEKVSRDLFHINGIRLSDLKIHFPTLEDFKNLKREFSPEELWAHLEKLQEAIGAKIASGEKEFVALKDYLTTITQWHLAQRGACFEYRVQTQVDPIRQPVDNALVEWSERLSPFKTVARIEIPMQTFLTDEQRFACENLSMNPKHGGTAAGLLNRIREDVYEDISALRHKANQTTPAEPTTVEPYATLLPEPSQRAMMQNNL